jgi:hypothetical protein
MSIQVTDPEQIGGVYWPASFSGLLPIYAVHGNMGTAKPCYSLTCLFRIRGQKGTAEPGLLDRSKWLCLPSRNWPLGRASPRFTTLRRCLESRRSKTNQQKISPHAYASVGEKEASPPARNECRHRRSRRGLNVLQRRHKGAGPTVPTSQAECSGSPS